MVFSNIFLIFNPNPGEMIQFDVYVSDGLVQLPASIYIYTYHMYLLLYGVFYTFPTVSEEDWIGEVPKDQIPGSGCCCWSPDPIMKGPLYINIFINGFHWGFCSPHFSGVISPLFLTGRWLPTF